MNGRHVTAHFAVFWFAYIGATRPMSENLIRVWTHRGKIHRVGTDAERYALYDLTEIMQHARLRGFFDNE